MTQVVAVMNGPTALAFTASSDGKTLTLATPPLSPPGLTLLVISADKTFTPYSIPVAAATTR